MSGWVQVVVRKMKEEQEEEDNQRFLVDKETAPTMKILLDCLFMSDWCRW
jgi:hypothetical protein